MKIHEVKPINFLFFRTRTTVDQLAQFIPVGQQLYREAVQHNLAVTGPVHWHYHEFTNPAAPFDLEVALPIAALPKEYDGPFHVKRTENFRCVTTIHEGSWYSIPQTYGKIMEYISGNGLSPSSHSRELYINVDPADDSANVTEIQFGVS